MAIAKIVVADVVHGEGEAADAQADLKAAAHGERPFLIGEIRASRPGEAQVAIEGVC